MQHRLSFLLDMMYGLRAIHNVGMIHGDLKTLNLLVTLEGRVKVADFGLSKLLGTVSIVPGTKTISGTPQYMAPEVMHCKPQGLRVDIYSVGIVMWEVMAGVIPWKDMDYVQIIQRVTHQANDSTRPPPGRPPVDNMFRAVAPSGFISLMEECWAQDPKWRPSADQCVEYLEEIKRRVHSGPFPHDQVTKQAHAQSWGTEAQMKGAAMSAVGDGHSGNDNESDQRQIPYEPGGKRQRVEGAMPYTGPGGAGGGGWDRTGTQRPQALAQQGPEFHHPLKPPNMFMASGGLYVLVDMLKSGNMDKVIQALSAVFEMCVNNPANQQAIFDASVLDHIFPLLDWWDRPDVQTKATNCIAVASSQNPHNRRTVVNMGAVASLVRLLSASPLQQEAAAQAIANTVKRPTAEEQQVLNDWEELTNTKGTIIDAQEELNRFGGVEKLVQLMEKGSSRVKLAAAAAVANAMTECNENRVAFQESNGIAQVIRMLKEGDCNAQVCLPFVSPFVPSHS
jgi:hypothetical protein